MAHLKTSADLAAFRVEVSTLAVDDNYPEFVTDEDGALRYNAAKIPVLYNDNESLCLVRIEDASRIDMVSSMTRLGTCINNNEYVFDSEVLRATYERVRGSLERTYTDDDGQAVVYNAPYMIGVFA